MSRRPVRRPSLSFVGFVFHGSWLAVPLHVPLDTLDHTIWQVDRKVVLWEREAA